MKLIMDNGNEYELIESKHRDFVFHSVEPNNDFSNVPQIHNITDGGMQPFYYKAIQINGKFYIPKFTNQ